MCNPGSTFVIAVLLALGTPPALCAQSLRIASDNWCPFICATDGKLTGGYLLDVTAQAMALQGYRVESLLRPLNRALQATDKGDLEGVYAPATDPRLRLSVPLAYSRACFYTLSDEPWSYRGLDSLRLIRLGAIDGYGYDAGPMDAYIGQNKRNPALIELAYGEFAGTTNLQKLLARRFLVILEHQAVMAVQAKSAGVTEQLREAGCLEQKLPLVIGFSSKDQRSEQWLRALAEGILKLQASGDLQVLLRRYALSEDVLQAKP
jgi:polar amino acid transport system substrate-binding protein